MASRSTFQSMVEDWAGRGLIEQEQLPILLQDLDHMHKPTFPNLMNLLFWGSAGILCLVAAMYTFIGNEASWLPNLVKAGFAILMPIVIAWLSVVTSRFSSQVCRLLRFLAVILVGVGIGAIDQAYEVTRNVPDLLRIWGLIGLILAFAVMSELGLMFAFSLLVFGLLGNFGQANASSPYVLWGTFIFGWLGYGVAAIYGWRTKNVAWPASVGSAFNGSAMKAMSLIYVWFAMLACYGLVHPGLTGSSSLYILYLVAYFWFLASMVLVARYTGLPFMGNGAIFMILLMLVLLYSEQFWQHADHAIFYLGIGLPLTAFGVYFEWSRRRAKANVATAKRE